MGSIIRLSNIRNPTKTDTLMISESNTYASNIANHFAGLYYLVIGASLLFHQYMEQSLDL